MRVALCALLLAVLLAVGLFSHFSIQNGLRALSQPLEGVLSDIDADDWAAAERHMEEITAVWRTKRPLFALLGRHQLYEQIYISIGSLPDALQAREQEAASQLALALREQLALMRVTEDLLWENVF